MITITKHSRDILRTVTCLAAALFIGTGCTAAFVNSATHGLFSQEETNFTEKNYAAADYMIQQAQSFIGRQDLILAEALSDPNQPGMSSSISKMIPEQMGIRLSQLGYRMDLSKVASSADTNYLKPSISKGEKPDFVLSGTYLRRRSEMDINMRIVDIHAGRVIASFDYILPMTREVSELATPKPKIVRMTDQ